MVAQPGIDAAHRVSAERIGRQFLLRVAQHRGGVAILTHEREEFRQMRAIFTPRVQRHRLLEMIYRGADALGARFDDPEQEMTFGLLRIIRQQQGGEASRRAHVATGKRTARCRDPGGRHIGHAVAAGSF